MIGILPINKPSGISSFKVTKTVGRLLNIKTGHAGTLDPLASGVLPVMLGSATKLSDIMLPIKSYDTVIKLGIKTSTGDILGEVLEASKVKRIDLQELKLILELFKGEITQIPPMYSALKKDGKPLYKLAREGIEVERKERKITIQSIALNSVTEDEIAISVSCSKGTYIRTLCEDIAEKTGNIGTMKSLTRTNSGNILLVDCIDFEEVNEQNIAKIEKKIVKVEGYFNYLNSITIPDNGLCYYKNGGQIEKSRLISNSISSKKIENTQKSYFRAYDTAGTFIGLAELIEEEETIYAKSLFLI